MSSKRNGGSASAGRLPSAQAQGSSRRSSRNIRVRKAVQANPDALRKILKEIGHADLARLRTLWRQHLRTEPPKLKTRELTSRLLAWQVQAEVLRGFDAWTTRRLRELANAFERDPAYKPSASITLRPGIVLTREWQGVQHRVLVQAGGFLHQGTTYKSLTQVARAITRTRWSGPRFFGLEANSRGRVEDDGK